MDVGFIRPAIKDDSHLRIPKDFYTTIGDLDAFTVYGVLKSAGPRHQWTANRVKVEIDKRFRGEGGRGLGRARVEKALALLNREGWIRYVDFVEPNGQHKGSAIEVQYLRLREDLRGRNRKICFRSDGQFTMYENDGSVVPPNDYSPKSSISKSDDSMGSSKSTKGTASRNERSQPHHRNPEERSPGERDSGAQYKGDKIEESPRPLSGKGVSNSLFDQEDLPGEKDLHFTDVPLPTDSVLPPPGEPIPNSEVINSDPGTTKDSDQSAQVCSVGESPSALFDVAKLWRMADAIKHDPDRRYQYEVFLFEQVIPVLKPPPVQERWTKPEALEWCQKSVLGQLFLSLSNDSEWTPELARRLVKNSGTFSVGAVRKILLAGPNPGKWGTLKELLNTRNSAAYDHDERTANHWKALCEWADGKSQSVRSELHSTIKKFSGHEDDESLIPSVIKCRQRLLNNDLCYEYGELLPLAVRSFRDACRSTDLSSHLQNPDFIASRDEQRMAFVHAFALDLPFLTVAMSIPNWARVIWGIDPTVLPLLRCDRATKLKRRAEIHGIACDIDSGINSTIERCKRAISKLPIDGEAVYLSQVEEWIKQNYPA